MTNSSKYIKYTAATVGIILVVLYLALGVYAASPPLSIGSPPNRTPARNLIRVSSSRLADHKSITLSADADATVVESQPTSNYGDAEAGISLRVGYDSFSGEYEGANRSLIRFNLASIPRRAQVLTATLRLYYCEYYDYEGQYRRISVHSCDDHWTEDSVTWLTQPEYGESFASLSLGIGDSSVGKFYSVDLTQLVQRWIDHNILNYGIVLKTEEIFGIRGFACSEQIDGQSGLYLGPQLIIHYAPTATGIDVSPQQLSFDYDVSQPHLGSATISVGSFTDDAVRWTATTSGTVPWLNLSDPEGSSSLLSPQAFAVTIDSSRANSGHHHANVDIVSVVPGTGPTTKRVEIDIDVRAHKAYSSCIPMLAHSTTMPNPRSQRLVALIIGISDYEHMTSPELSRAGAPGYDLMHGTDDAGDISFTLEALNDPEPDCECLGGTSLFSCGRSTFLSDSILTLTDGQATKSNIQRAIEGWLDQREDRNSRVIVFFSGHGLFGPDSDGDEADGFDEYLAPSDIACDPCYPDVEDPVWLMDTAIRDDELATWLDRLESESVAIIVDSCFSGGMLDRSASGASIRGLSDTSGPQAVHSLAGDGLANDLASGGRVVMTATRADQESLETSQLRNGVYTYYLTEALWSLEADENRDGWVSAREAHQYLADRVDQYVYTKTFSEANGVGNHQNPCFVNETQRDLVLTRPHVSQ